jgi:phage gp45-like
MSDKSQRGRALDRDIKRSTKNIEASVDGLIEWAEADGITAGDGEVPVATGEEDEEIQLLEPYGFASSPASSTLILAFSPGGDGEARVGIATNVGNRPATEAGDTALWTTSGHRVFLTNDGGIKIESKDGSTLEITEDGDIVATPIGGKQVKLGNFTATRGVARLQDLTIADITMLAWLISSQALLSGIAPLLGLSPPIAPTDFGVINTASSDVVST